MHDYSVMSLVNDLLDGNPFQEIKDEKAAASCFNEEDPYWQLYKCGNASAAQIDLEEQVGEYQENQAEYLRLKNKLDNKKATEEDMLSLVREQNEIHQRNTWFIEHRKLLAKLQALMIEN